jgi:hypothetical protein
MIDPRDLRTTTIEKLFYYQVQNQTMKTAQAEDRMKLFDFQFSDAWTRGELYDVEI